MNSKSKIFFSSISLLLSVFCFGQVKKSKKVPDGFAISSINSELHQKMISTHVFSDQSPVPIDRLRLLKLKYFGFDKIEHEGEIIVLDACSRQVLQIFIELYGMRFPMETVALMSKFAGSDSLSMAANNTSAHNFRQITGGNRLSLHAYGTAIDINPVNNPYVEIACDDSLGMAKYQPAAGIKFANRMENRLGKTNREGLAEEVVDVFAKYGFYWWGGYWNCPIDYQHFQISRSISELLVAMPADEATAFFETAVAYFNQNQQPIEDALESKIGAVSLADFYRQDAKKFFEVVGQID